MRKSLSTVAVMALAVLMSLPAAADHRGRGNMNNGKGSSHTSAPANRSDNKRPGGNNNRPGGHDNRPNNNNRPGDNNHRPDNHRPGGNNNRPGGHDNRPGNNNRPHDNNHPGGHNNRPSASHGTPPPPPGAGNHHGHRPPHWTTPPHRPMMPRNYHWHVPVRPPHFRPSYNAPRLSTILGVTFGTALGYSLDLLLNTGYVVSGYGNDVIYLTNVPMLSYNWPDVTMIYNNGFLSGSEFTYSTSWSDVGRYNNLYRNLYGQYGAPVSVQNNSGGYSATWYGYNRGFVTISYYPGYASDGTFRYFTTLSVGG